MNFEAFSFVVCGGVSVKIRFRSASKKSGYSSWYRARLRW